MSPDNTSSSFPPESPATLSSQPLPTPSHGAGGHFTICCSTIVVAAPLTCLEVVLNSPQYPSWNRFCRKCTITSQPSTPAAPHGIPPRLLEPEDYLKLGTKFTFDVHMDPAAPVDAGKSGRATDLELSVLEQFDEEVVIGGDAATTTTKRSGYRVAWKTRTTTFSPGWMLRAERIQEFVQIGTQGDQPQTAYRCWETFYGALAPVVKLAVASQLVNCFNAWMEGMKKTAEEADKMAGRVPPPL